MPKRKRQPEAAVARPAPRRPSARIDAERRNQMLVVVLAVAVVIVALGIALFGYYQTNIAPKGDPVLKVEDRSFSLRYFERRARYEVRSGNITALGDPTETFQFLSFMAQEGLISMVQREELIRRGAAEKGIILTEEDIDNEIRRRENVAPDADRTTFAAAYRQAVRDSGLATSDFRDLIAAELLENRLREKFRAEVPLKTEQVRYRLIQVETTEEAEAVIERLEAGEDFAELARELSINEATKDVGGDMGWAPLGTLPADLEDVLLGLEPGQHSGVIERPTGAVIFKLEQREPDRATTQEQQRQLANRAFESWLDGLRERTRIVTFLDQDQSNEILRVLLNETA